MRDCCDTIAPRSDVILFQVHFEIVLADSGSLRLGLGARQGKEGRQSGTFNAIEGGQRKLCRMSPFSV